ncbi:MAG: tRNA (guanosine(37)-N1)-methyltransferase TrmD, partial [Turneriella sp.]|nr:tRNA (guanosine(37)-N1)-methyltransferase TrmD [Turneriella sp.]
KAFKTGLVRAEFYNPRAYTPYKHRRVDDAPYGGGAGMVLMAEPIARAVEAIRSQKPDTHVVLLSARGRIFNTAIARRYAGLASLTLICGHYEGVDERVAEHVADESVRIGDYVLSGGEPAALVILDAVARRIPGVIGNAASLGEESFENVPSCEYPQYTRPEVWRGHRVPEVLLSGDHARIAAWRAAQRKNPDET